jgi:sec-independent protein translocase protein TatC
VLSKLNFLRRKKSPSSPDDAPPETATEEVNPALYADGAEMGFLEHLDELRISMFRAAIALVLGTTFGVLVAAPVLEYLIEPYSALYPEQGRELLVLGPTGGVVIYFKVGLMLGGIFASPIMTYNLLMFILPALTVKQVRYVQWSMPAIGGLFITGVLFAWFVLIPPAITFLEGFQEDIFRPEWTAGQYISFVTSLLFWMGVAFEIPLIFFVLSLLGLVKSRTLIRNWRGAIVGASIAAAVITPTVDPVNMSLVMGPLLALYVASIVLVSIGRRIGGHNN